MNKIKLKPHHFLDILKLYGKGLDHFIPNEEYKHDFYRIANLIVDGKVDKIILTIGNDDICNPCIHNNDNKCSDKVGNTDKSKQLHNLEIDKQLILDLKLKEEIEIEFKVFLDILKEEINITMYKNAWKYANEEEIEFRYKYGMIGLGKVIRRYNKL